VQVDVLSDLPLRSREVDALGLATVLLLGFPLGRKTVLRDVVATAPDAPAGSVDAYGLQPRADAVAAEELRELFIEALRRELPVDPPVLMLSGGRDSRLILFGLRALDRLPLEAISTGDHGDRIVARRLADRFGIPFREVEPANFATAREFERHRRLSFASLEHQWMFSAAECARAGGCPVTDGIGAGVLPTGSFLKPEVMAMWDLRRLDEIASWAMEHANGIGVPMFEALRETGLPIASIDEVRHEIVSVLRALDGLPNPLGSFSLLHWTGRGIASSAFGLIGGGRRVVAPLFDRALCEALMSVEARDAVRQDWRDTLLQSFDDTGIPLASTLAPRAVRRRPIIDRVRSAVAWRGFVGGLNPDLRRIAASMVGDKPPHRTFRRTALSLLGALERERILVPGAILRGAVR
jgi:hypothetical protein